MITRMDRDVGRLLEKVRQLGLDENTLVIFASDNGPAVAGGSDPSFFQSSGPLRGQKFGLYEGGIRVPMIARWPGHVAKGTTTHAPSAFWDMFPTFAELAGAKTPDGLDGLSIVPTLLGKTDSQKTHEYLYWEYNGSQAVRFGQHKAIRKVGGTTAVYDLQADIGEKNDLADQHPDLVRKAEQYMAAAHADNPNWPLIPTTKPAAKGKGAEPAGKSTGVDAE
jgi:arylsulfatase A-like enzyme